MIQLNGKSDDDRVIQDPVITDEDLYEGWPDEQIVRKNPRYIYLEG